MEVNIKDFERLSVLGLSLKITLRDEWFIGDVYYFDSASNLLILKETFQDTDLFNFRYINTEEITSINVISSKNIDQFSLETETIDFEKLLSDERERRERVKQTCPISDQRITKLFSQIKKIYPEAEWLGRVISLPRLGIQILPPYTSNDIQGNVQSAKVVKKQIDNVNFEFGH